jgi:transcription elongation factor Elf1
MKNQKCLNCGHTQEVNEKNVYQDIQGKFTVCESCNSSYDVEIQEEN